MIPIFIPIPKEDLEAYGDFLCEGLEEFPWLSWFITTLICSGIWYYFTPYGLSFSKVILCLCAGGFTACGLGLLWMLVEDIFGGFIDWLRLKMYYWRGK